ncbi:MAG: hypothetical protein Pars2KO_23700 [Parasphingorhabdus sp.]
MNGRDKIILELRAVLEKLDHQNELIASIYVTQAIETLQDKNNEEVSIEDEGLVSKL